MNLRDYQIDISNKAYKILLSHKIVYLALETRTGKTLTALETANKYGAKKVLFITKKKAIQSITTDYNLLKPLFEIEVINYESVHKSNIKADLIIIDEAHGLSALGKPTLKTKRVKEVCINKPIIYLSGSPSPETFSGLYHQFWVSTFSPFKKYINFYKWSHDYINIKQRMINGRLMNDYKDANIEKIDEDTKHLFITFTQKDAGFEHIIKEKFLTVKMNDIQKKTIEILKKDRVLNTKDGNVILADTAVKLQSKIHQICSGTIKDENGNIHEICTNKADFLKEYFTDKKIAIFYKFIGEFNILKKVFAENWTSNPEEFQTTNKTFLGQFISSREGIRLDEADAVVFYNIDFSYLSYTQAKDRIISKERTKQAILYWVFSNDGIENKIYNAVSKKSNYTTHFFKEDYDLRK